MSKTKLKLDEQIEHMKSKNGISYKIVDETAAKEFLLKHNYYFRVKAYAKNYDKYNEGENKGKYINLDFAYLQELSTLDMYFRKLILKMTIDIEHFLKVQLMRDFEANEREDGYAIVDDFLAQNSRVKENIERLKYGSLCCDLIDKYMDNFALWNIIEVMSFGDFISLYNFYYKKYPTKNDMSNLLWSARILRNAAAHNNCLLNSLKNPYTRKISRNWEVTKYISQMPGIGKDARKKKMSNPIIYDFVVTLHLFNKVVSSEKVKSFTMHEFQDLFKNRFKKNEDYFSKNEIIKSSFEFIRKVVDFYNKK